MRLFLNITWFLLFGVLYTLVYALVGAVLCATLVGIPLGIKCFKLAGFAVHPFGRTVQVDPSDCVTRNVLWCAIIGMSVAIECLLVGAILCVTVIGIPFGLQCFKLMKLSYAPFGSTVEKD